jgi:hypothetical protein
MTEHSCGHLHCNPCPDLISSIAAIEAACDHWEANEGRHTLDPRGVAKLLRGYLKLGGTDAR